MGAGGYGRISFQKDDRVFFLERQEKKEIANIANVWVGECEVGQVST